MGAVSNTAARFDPTTPEGRAAIATGGLSEVYNDAVDPALQKLDDKISGQEQLEAERDAIEAQEAAEQDALAFSKEQYQDFLDMTQAYRDTGEDFLPQLTAFLDPAQQDIFKAEALQSQGFKDILSQSTESLLANQSAMGGMRGGNAQNAVMQNTGMLAQDYGNQAVQNRLGNLTQGVNIGSGILGNTMSVLGQQGSNITNSMRNIGNLNAQREMAGSGSGLAPYLQLAGQGAQAYRGFV